MTIKEETLRVLPFSGNQKDWEVWETKFLAKMKRKGLKKVLVCAITDIPKFKKITESNKYSDEETKLLENNSSAYDELLLSITGKTKAGKVAFRLVKTSKNEDYPDGNAAMAWQRLEEKYASKTTASLIGLTGKFYKSRLKNKKDDPDDWITDLEDIRARIATLGGKISDNDMIIKILNGLPKAYTMVVTLLEKRLNHKKNPLTLEDVRSDLNNHYSKMYPDSDDDSDYFGGGDDSDSDDSDDDDEKEKAMFSTQFKGKCHNCGKIGHKSPDCPDKKKKSKNQGGYKFRGKCRFCGKLGHKWADCRARLASEGATSATERAEVVMMGYDGPMWCQETVMSDVGSVDVGLSDLRAGDVINANTWIGDTGASCHMRNDAKGMFDTKKISEGVTVGNNENVKATMIGKWRGVVTQRDGTKQKIVLQNVKYVPDLCTNLFSITQCLSNKWKISNEGTTIVLTKGEYVVKFDRKHNTQTGYVGGVTIKPTVESSSERKSVTPLKKDTTMSIVKAHAILGHANDSTVRSTAKHYGWKVTGTLPKCENCSVAKAQRKAMPKESGTLSVVPGERLCIDISSIKVKSYGGNKFWLLVVDECTDMCWSFFLKKKSDLVPKMLEFITDMRAKGKKGFGKIIRCDNAGENHKLEEFCKKDGFGCVFEYTAPGTPQQNGKVERKFATLHGKVRSMLNGARVTRRLRDLLWCEAACTATHYENMLVTANKEIPSYTQFYRVEPPFVRNLRTFGEMATITNVQKKIKGKLENRGNYGMFVGYSTNHEKDVFRFLDLTTDRVRSSRDVTWLGKSYGEHKGFGKPKVVRLVEPDDDDDDDYENSNDANGRPDEFGREVDANQEIPRVDPETPDDEPPKVPRQVQRLASEFNPLAEAMVEGKDTDVESGRVLRSGREIGSMARDEVIQNEFQEFMYGTVMDDVGLMAFDKSSFTPQVETVTDDESVNDDENVADDESVVDDTAKSDDLVEPTTFRDAWDHPDPVQREKWREAIRKEFGDMNRRGVWRKILRSKMPRDRRCVKNKWVFKIKRNGVFRARLVACGYSQIAGVDFSDNYAPVINDVTWRILMVIMLRENLDGIIIDVETAFLHGDLEEDIYMECPEGLEHDMDEILQLKKTIYGLVQSARQFWKKLVKVLKKLGFKGGYPDPCLMMRRDEDGVIYIALYVDDCLCIGTRRALRKFAGELPKNGFTVKIEWNLMDYVSCEIKRSKDGRSATMRQPHLLKNLRAKFWDHVKNLQVYRTPGTPGNGLMRPLDKKPKVTVEVHMMYRSGVGMLLFLVKHTRPDIANPVRELSKLNDCPTPIAVKEMFRVIKFVLDTPEKGLKMKPELNDVWRIVAYSDSDYAGDKETRISVTGFIIFLLGCPVCWRSKGQKSVTLSSSEAEYVALSEVAKEVKFVYMVLQMLQIEVKLPIVVRVDNIGAIFMAENVTTSNRTKHVDVRFRFVNEFVTDGFIDIIFVKTKENIADIFTKNTSGEILDVHQGTMLT